MNVKRVPADEGRSAWVKSIEPFSLPAGLNDGDEITILDASGFGELVVQDCEGNRHTLLKLQVDTGYEYELAPGNWRPENDPEVLARLSLVIDHLRPSNQSLKADSGKKHTVELVTRILKRNGFLDAEAGQPKVPGARTLP